MRGVKREVVLIFHTQLQVYADTFGTIEMQDNTMLQFCSTNSAGGGICSKGNVSLSGNGVVSGCNAMFGGGIAILGAEAVVEIREAAEVVRCAAIRGGVCHLLDTSLQNPHTQVG